MATDTRGRLIIQSDAASQEVGGASAFRAMLGNIDRNFQGIEQGLGVWANIGSGGSAGTSAEPSLRLSLTRNTAVTTADTSGTTIFGVAVGNNMAVLWDSVVGLWTVHSFLADLELPLGATIANGEYSVFLFWDIAATPAPALRLGYASPWTRTEVQGPSNVPGNNQGFTETFQGRLVNQFPISLTTWTGTGTGTIVRSAIPAREALLVGGFATALAGVVEDSNQKRLLSNVFNATPRSMVRNDTTSSWAGDGTNQFRYANGNSANRLELFSITGTFPVHATALGISAVSSGSTVFTATAIGVGSPLDAPGAGHQVEPYPGSLKVRNVTYNVSGETHENRANFSGFPGIGRKYITWLELTGGGGTIPTWFGIFTNASFIQSGIVGAVIN